MFAPVTISGPRESEAAATADAPLPEPVKHYFRRAELELAVGTPRLLAAFCGAVESVRGYPVREKDVVPTVGKFVVLPGTRDCEDCFEIYSTLLRAQGGLS